MTPEEFQALLDTYGADLTRWPHARRQAAHRLLQVSEAARIAFADAQSLDAQLAVAEPPLSAERRGNLLDSIMDNLPDDAVSSQGRVIAMPVRPLPRPSVRPRVESFGVAALVRPFGTLWAGCLGFGILIGVGLYLGHLAMLPHVDTGVMGSLGLLSLG